MRIIVREKPNGMHLSYFTFAASRCPVSAWAMLNRTGGNKSYTKDMGSLDVLHHLAAPELKKNSSSNQFYPEIYIGFAVLGLTL